MWDSDKKRWVNLEEDNGDASTELKPPPKMSEMFNRTTTSSLPSMPPPQMPQNNVPVAVMPSVAMAAPITDESTANIINNQNQPLDNPNSNEIDKKPPSGANMFKLQRGRSEWKNILPVPHHLISFSL